MSENNKKTQDKKPNLKVQTNREVEVADRKIYNMMSSPFSGATGLPIEVLKKKSRGNNITPSTTKPKGSDDK